MSGSDFLGCILLAISILLLICWVGENIKFNKKQCNMKKIKNMRSKVLNLLLKQTNREEKTKSMYDIENDNSYNVCKNNIIMKNLPNIKWLSDASTGYYKFDSQLNKRVIKNNIKNYVSNQVLNDYSEGCSLKPEFNKEYGINPDNMCYSHMSPNGIISI